MDIHDSFDRFGKHTVRKNGRRFFLAIPNPGSRQGQTRSGGCQSRRRRLGNPGWLTLCGNRRIGSACRFSEGDFLGRIGGHGRGFLGKGPRGGRFQ